MRVSARLSRAGVSREKEEERNEGEWRIQPGGVGAAVVYGQHECRRSEDKKRTKGSTPKVWLSNSALMTSRNTSSILPSFSV